MRGEIDDRSFEYPFEAGHPRPRQRRRRYRGGRLLRRGGRCARACVRVDHWSCTLDRRLDMEDQRACTPCMQPTLHMQCRDSTPLLYPIIDQSTHVTNPLEFFHHPPIRSVMNYHFSSIIISRIFVLNNSIPLSDRI